MATQSETDLSTPPWGRGAFKAPFMRRPRRNKGSDTSSIGGGNEGSQAGDSPTVRRDSGDSGRRLSLRLGKKRSKLGLGRHESDSGSSEMLSRSTTDEAIPKVQAPEEDEGTYTEEEDESTQLSKRPTLSPHHSHIGYLTASSPLITTETVDLAPLSHAESAPTIITTITGGKAASSRSSTLKAPTNSSQRRSPSPVGRLKDAFKTRRSSTSPAGLDSVRASETQAEGPVDVDVGGSEARGRKTTPSPLFFADKQLVNEPALKTPSPRKTPATRALLTAIPSTPPGLNGPATVVTPPTPTDPTHGRSPSTPINIDSIQSPEVAHTSSTGSESGPGRTLSSAHRRVKSAGQPSKLSSSSLPPLTPAIEEVKTPGGTITVPTVAGGFFSSMFSAAQSAATTLTNTIAVGNNQRNRSSTDPKAARIGGEEVILPPGSELKDSSSPGERKQLAIATLGSGNLSLSHLGITDTNATPMNSNSDLVSGLRRDEMSAKAEDDAVARAVSMAYSEPPTNDKTASVAPSVEDAAEATPTRPTAEPESGSIRRAGSVRSRLSNRRRRTRGSSAATGHTIAPAASASKVQGFAVANSKRNKDFHALFKSVPEDDYLIEDYSAALQREILLQGRLYISEGHICFASNILGWVTNLVMSFDEIIAVEKKATAVIFQNGIFIQTLQTKASFASLLSRDTTYDLIIAIWRTNHPNLRSLMGNDPIDGNGTGDRTVKIESPTEQDGSASDEVYDEDEEDDEDDDEDDINTSIAEAPVISAAVSEAGEVTTSKVQKRLSSNPIGAITQNGQAKANVDAVESVATGASTSADFPGPATHAATDCGDAASHLEKVLIEDTIPAPLGKIYSLMFGPASGKFMRRWLLDDQKSLDLQLEDDGKGLDNEHKQMTYSYVKPLSGSIGPKQTKCIINQTLETFDLAKAVTVSCSTQNPDVPSGNIFVVKTRYCLSWGPNNSTKYTATCQIEWSGKSWLKGPIEKGANDGQLQYQKDIVAALKAAVTTKSSSKSGGKGKSGKAGGKRKKDSADLTASQNNDSSEKAKTSSKASGWGPLEPLREILDMIPSSIIIGLLLVVILVLFWRLNRSSTSSSTSRYPHSRNIDRYESLWAQEEDELWRWLEARAGVEGSVPKFLKDGQGEEARQKVLKEKRVDNMKGKVEGMEERKVREAIRITRERLEALEEAVGAGGGSGGERGEEL